MNSYPGVRKKKELVSRGDEKKKEYKKYPV
jgi:hypothetical protein